MRREDGWEERLPEWVSLRVWPGRHPESAVAQDEVSARPGDHLEIRAGEPDDRVAVRRMPCSRA